MDKSELVKNILDSYKEITVIDNSEEIVFFLLEGKEYGCWYPDIDKATSRPIFLVKNEGFYDYPHILPTSIPLDKSKSDKYRYVCLYETDSTIKFLQSKEEKLKDAIEQLIALISLSPLEREREFQKEFLYYWNIMSENNDAIRLYIRRNEQFQRMNTYRDENNNIRCVANGIKLSDANEVIKGKKKWNHTPELPGFYIFIEDNRRILPPTMGKKWTANDILNIICGKDVRRISHECYYNLGKEKIKTSKVSLIFEMIVNGNYINFATIITFKDARNDSLLNKLKQDIVEVHAVKSKRVDYYHLCRQIGNDTSLLNKKALVVGAGSLGSYTAKELVKAGIKDITIYDEDKLEDENLLRHASKGFWVGYSKARALKYELEYIHPEIHINAIDKNINESTLIKEIEKIDLIIFTVGSSDTQLELNRVLKRVRCRKTVIYTWLEAGGAESHILVIDYSKQGCFECLFTDKAGNLINNKANQVVDTEIEKYRIRNGCGATRVAYGNVILLRTVGVLLDTIKKLFDDVMKENTLININSSEVLYTGNDFVEGECQCCGNRNFK